ncbi:MAG: FAD-dependent oxidoreductase [Candidatus Omnitrophota bacterium]|nr:FAD-dependent oxidoreductase [Candidatus Omnitrophota bacterium]
MDKLKIVVLGAGPAGLSCAWKLAEAGYEVVVLEKEDQVGGICRTIRRGDYLFDLGGHRFITKDEELGRVIQELMADELLTTPRKSVIRLRGKYFQYPLELKNLFFNMDKLFLIESMCDYIYSVVSKRLLNKQDASFEDWVVNRFGRALYNVYFGVYTEKLWGISPKQISADWAAQRISLLNLWDVLTRLAGKESNRPKTYALEFAYPKAGIGRISDRMREEIEKNGGKIILGAKVNKIFLDDVKIKKVGYQHGGELKDISADWIVSSIPINEFIGSMDPAPRPEYAQAAKAMRFRAVRFLNLIVDAEEVTDNTWMYIPEKSFLFFRIQEPKNWSRASAPAGKTSLILEIACNPGDEIATAPEEIIFDRCKKDLDKLGLFDTSKIREYFTTYVEHGYPIYDLTYKDKVAGATRLLKSISNLVPIGRQGLFRYNNMDHSIKMGFLAAEHILHGGMETRIFSIASESVAFEIEKNLEKRI